MANSQDQFVCDICEKPFADKWKLQKHSKTHEDKHKVSCSICAAVLKNQHSLDRHILDVHSDQLKLLECDICEQKFSNEGSLRKHQQHVHSSLEISKSCDICSKTFKNEATLKHHISKIHERNTKVSCKECGKSYSDQTNLRIHMTSSHERYQAKLKCDHCDFRAEFPRGIKNHVESVHFEKSYECEYCGIRINSEQHWKNHVKRLHEEQQKCPICDEVKFDMKNHMLTHSTSREKKFKCEKCPYKAERACLLKKHNEIVHELIRKYSCELCDKKFTGGFALKEHMKISHGDGEKKHICKTCGFRTITARNLKRHIEYSHSTTNDTANLKCNLCEKILKGDNTLRVHMKMIHSNKIYKCSECLQTFKNSKNLRRHFLNIHDTETPLKQCELCPKSFRSQESLTSHKKVHNKGPKRKMYPCSICEYRASVSRMSDHMKTVHCDERPFKCSVCQTAFKLNSLLKTHFKNLHTNDAKKYSCDQCDYESIDKRHLKTHVDSIHLGLRPFKCDTCESTFTQKPHLNTHKKTVHSKNEYQCRNCDERFNNDHSRISHEKRIHKGESLKKDRYKCPNCDYIGETAANLSRHSFKHTEERPLNCICGNFYVTEHELKSHISKSCKEASDLF